MQSSIVGLSILWGLASFGVQGDFIESRDSVAPSWQAESRVEMEGYLIESLGEDRWVFDNGSESLLVSLPEGQWVSEGERLRLSGEPQQEQAGWLLQVQDVSQVGVWPGQFPVTQDAKRRPVPPLAFCASGPQPRCRVASPGG